MGLVILSIIFSLGAANYNSFQSFVKRHQVFSKRLSVFSGLFLFSVDSLLVFQIVSSWQNSSLGIGTSPLNLASGSLVLTIAAILVFPVMKSYSLTSEKCLSASALNHLLQMMFCLWIPVVYQVIGMVIAVLFGAPRIFFGFFIISTVQAILVLKNCSKISIGADNLGKGSVNSGAVARKRLKSIINVSIFLVGISCLVLLLVDRKKFFILFILTIIFYCFSFWLLNRHKERT